MCIRDSHITDKTSYETRLDRGKVYFIGIMATVTNYVKGEYYTGVPLFYPYEEFSFDFPSDSYLSLDIFFYRHKRGYAVAIGILVFLFLALILAALCYRRKIRRSLSAPPQFPTINNRQMEKFDVHLGDEDNDI
eukprot:TRINITY_DN777_c0_g1_i4.p2 TRINITY_DN777_c0_g1~~TRINITY_DN777_c0_g1_i4.p2  ORF type:complete len:134 (-),score=12.45 TRINITY_DN777_c0_g1_i4:45-446(-)